MQRLLLTAAPLALCLLAGSSLRVEDSVSFDGIERVKLRWASGDLQIKTRDGDIVHAAVQSWGPEAALAFDARRDAEILVLTLQCRTPAPCGGDLDLTLPRGIDLEVDLGDGRAALQGQLGDLSVVVGSGNIRAGALETDSAVLQVVDGPIRAVWMTAPQRVVAASVTSDIELYLPQAAYALENHALRSSVVGVEISDTSPLSIQVTTLEGEARLHGVRAMVEIETELDPVAML